MDVVVISLRTAAERRVAAEKHLRDLGVRYELFDAVPGTAAIASHATRVDARAFRLNAQRNPLPGELGCFASHRAVWQLALDRGRPLIVLEDDFMPLTGFRMALPTLDRVMDACDFVRLEPIWRRRALFKRWRPLAYHLRTMGAFELLYLSDVPLCLTGYAISPHGAEQLIRASRRIVAPVDKFVQRTWAHGIPVHALNPPIVQASDLAGTSTIGFRRQLKSRSPRLLLARALYKGYGEVKRLRFDRRQLAQATPARIHEINTLAPHRR